MGGGRGGWLEEEECVDVYEKKKQLAIYGHAASEITQILKIK